MYDTHNLHLGNGELVSAPVPGPLLATLAAEGYEYVAADNMSSLYVKSDGTTAVLWATDSKGATS